MVSALNATKSRLKNHHLLKGFNPSPATDATELLLLMVDGKEVICDAVLVRNLHQNLGFAVQELQSPKMPMHYLTRWCPSSLAFSWFISPISLWLIRYLLL